MRDLIEKAQKYKYTSFTYIDEEEIDIISSNRILEEQDHIFIIKEEKVQFHIYWAAQNKEAFIKGILKSLKIIDQSNANKKRIYLGFIHEDFLFDLEKLGFSIDSQFFDFWIKDTGTLDVQQPSFVNVRLMNKEEYKEVGAVTRSCRGLSRGFNGEEDAFVKEWINDENSCIIVAEENNTVVGACFMNIYGFDSEKGTVAWLREIAVHPDHQGKGIGYSLIHYGLNWGKKQGAVRSFLAVDSNNNAIKLYEKFGYRKADGFGEINMVRL